MRIGRFIYVSKLGLELSLILLLRLHCLESIVDFPQLNFNRGKVLGLGQSSVVSGLITDIKRP